jgi:hypothetical protein
MTGTKRQNANFQWFNFGENIDECFCEKETLLRKCIISADSEQILKIHIERPGYGVYWP